MKTTEYRVPERPPLPFSGKVFMAIVFLLFALYTGILVRDVVQG